METRRSLVFPAPSVHKLPLRFLRTFVENLRLRAIRRLNLWAKRFMFIAFISRYIQELIFLQMKSLDERYIQQT